MKNGTLQKLPPNLESDSGFRIIVAMISMCPDWNRVCTCRGRRKDT
jgi:hypothetical protein